MAPPTFKEVDDAIHSLVLLTPPYPSAVKVTDGYATKAFWAVHVLRSVEDIATKLDNDAAHYLTHYERGRTDMALEVQKRLRDALAMETCANCGGVGYQCVVCKGAGIVKGEVNNG
jgi:hypothetical protein